MAFTTHTLTGDVADLIGNDFANGKVKVTLEPSQSMLSDGTTEVRLGSIPGNVADDGTFTIPNVPSSTAGFPLYRVLVRWTPDKDALGVKGPQEKPTGWFEMTADRTLAWVVQNTVEPTILSPTVVAQITAAAALGDNNNTMTASFVTEEGPTKEALSATIAAARHSNTLAMIGDSFLANTLVYDGGTLAWQHKPSAMLTGGRILLGQRLELVKDAGISGNTTTQMLARYETDVTPYSPGWVFIGGGTNDVDGSATAATIIANLSAMFDLADRDHSRIIAATIPPRDANTTAKNAVLFEVNEWIRREAFTRPGMVLVDLYAALADPTAATFISGLSLDGIHPYTTAGGWRMGRAFANALENVVPPVPVLPSSNVDSRSLITCGMFTGTAGGKGTGVTGTTATGWFVEPAPSLTCTAVASKVARTDLGPGDMQQIEVTAGTAQARARNTAVGTAWNPGDEVYATIAFEADTLPTTPAASVFDLNVTCYNADFSRLLRGVDNGLMAYEFEALNIPASGVLRTPSITIPALTTTLQITITMSAGATVRLYQAELVKGSWL